MPATEIKSYGTVYITTTDAAPQKLCDQCATVLPGEAVWLHARVKAANSTKSWYAEYIFFARRIGVAAPVIHSKELLSYAPEGKVNWDLEMVPVGIDSVIMRVIGQAGVTIDWAVSTRGFKKFPL